MTEEQYKILGIVPEVNYIIIEGVGLWNEETQTFLTDEDGDIIQTY